MEKSAEASHTLMTWDVFADRYCRSQVALVDGLKTTLQAQKERYEPVGWMLLMCADMSSSQLGWLYILPYGPNNTHKTPPTRPFSVSGQRASDTCMVLGLLPATGLPA